MSTTLFPVGGRSIVERMCNKFPELHVNVDEKQRVLTQRIDQQFCYTFGPKYGGKVRAGLDPETERGKDSCAALEADGTVSVWDLFQGNAAATILVHDGDAPTHPNLSPAEAEFIPETPINWLEDAAPPVPQPPPDTDLDERVEALEQETRAQATQIGELQFQNGLQQAQIDDHQTQITALRARLAALEAIALTTQTPLKVVGRTETRFGHQHAVNLSVTKEG